MTYSPSLPEGVEREDVRVVIKEALSWRSVYSASRLGTEEVSRRPSDCHRDSYCFRAEENSKRFVSSAEYIVP